MASSSFVTEEKFADALIRKREDTSSKKWNELLLDEIYKIVNIEKKISAYGVCYLMSCQSREGEFFKVFAPRYLIEEFRRLQRPNYAAYFISLGVERNPLTNHTRNKFDLVFVHEEGCLSIDLDNEPPNV